MVTKKSQLGKKTSGKSKKKAGDAAEPWFEINELIAKRLGDELKDPKNHKMKTMSGCWGWPHQKPSKFSGFGLLLLLIGLFWLGNELGWFSFELPFWPIVLVVLGLYFIFNKLLG